MINGKTGRVGDGRNVKTDRAKIGKNPDTVKTLIAINGEIGKMAKRLNRRGGNGGALNTIREGSRYRW